MLLAPFERFSDHALEAQYQQSKRERLSHADSEQSGGGRCAQPPSDVADLLRPNLLPRAVRSAALFVLLWAHDLWRFLGAHPLALIKATIWMAAVGMKPTLHLQEAASRGGAATLAALWELANGMRLPYIMLAGLGWQDLLYNVPVQLALVVRAIRDNQAQCAAPFFTAPQTREVLTGLAHRLTSLLCTSLSLGAGIKGQQSSFPAGLDPCCALGAWAAICFGFLLTTVAVTAGERRARARFALRHSARLTDSERDVFVERRSAGSWGTWAVFAYLCVLAWQAVLVAFSWAAGEGLYSLNVFALGSDGATPNTSAA
ncbi:hypothetical protein D9Q98_009558 [Chlorella vulgaris]|uniref:Uncharacterized protein n=1 Tax=Chlorella vulgaris TaxID=3077 RepID=A0A9D4TFF8_CHLVU|nr:hypothetical protein D9Q98_009558 [Chlorella vulgaris]